jgi:hypothetical protein
MDRWVSGLRRRLSASGICRRRTCGVVYALPPTTTSANVACSPHHASAKALLSASSLSVMSPVADSGSEATARPMTPSDRLRSSLSPSYQTRRSGTNDLLALWGRSVRRAIAHWLSGNRAKVNSRSPASSRRCLCTVQRSIKVSGHTINRHSSGVPRSGRGPPRQARARRALEQRSQCSPHPTRVGASASGAAPA